MGGYGANPGWGEWNDVWKSGDGGIIWNLSTNIASWSARRNHRVIVMGGVVYLAGGISSNIMKNDVWRSNDCVTWALVTATAWWYNGKTEFGRKEHGFVAIGSNKMLIFGGINAAVLGGNGINFYTSTFKLILVIILYIYIYIYIYVCVCGGGGGYVCVYVCVF